MIAQGTYNVSRGRGKGLLWKVSVKKTLQDETHTVPLPTYQRGYVLSILAKPKRDFQRARILGLPGPDLSASTEIIACLVETRSLVSQSVKYLIPWP